MTVKVIDAKFVDVLSRKTLLVGKKGKLQLAATIFFLCVMTDVYQEL